MHKSVPPAVKTETIVAAHLVIKTKMPEMRTIRVRKVTYGFGMTTVSVNADNGISTVVGLKKIKCLAVSCQYDDEDIPAVYIGPNVEAKDWLATRGLADHESTALISYFTGDTKAANKLSFENLSRILAVWSQITFGNDQIRGPIGPLKHMLKELETELLPPDGDPGSLEEQADLLILLLDVARRSGYTWQKLLGAAVDKMDENIMRDYPMPVGDDVSEHIKKTPPMPVGTKPVDDMTLADCRSELEFRGVELPTGLDNPWTMTREQLVTALIAANDDANGDDDTNVELLGQVIDAIDAGQRSGLDVWRNAVETARKVSDHDDPVTPDAEAEDENP